MQQRERRLKWGKADKSISLGYSIRGQCFSNSFKSVHHFVLLKYRLLMEELVNFIERVPKAQSASLWKNKDIQRWATVLALLLDSRALGFARHLICFLSLCLNMYTVRTKNSLFSMLWKGYVWFSQHILRGNHSMYKVLCWVWEFLKISKTAQSLRCSGVTGKSDN